MKNFTLGHFLTDINPERPCGENLALDHDFALLENEAKFIPERQMGNVITPEKAPNWKNVRDLALTLLAKSRDIQVAMHLTCALVNIEGFNGLHNGVTLIIGLLQKHWDLVYPLRDPEDDYPVLLMNTLFTLDDSKKMLTPLSNCPIAKSKLGEFSWNQFEMARAKVEALGHLTQESYVESLKKKTDKTAPDTLEEAKIKASADFAVMDAAFNETDLPILEEMADTLKHTSEQTEAIVRLTTEKVGVENAPDLSRLMAMLNNIQKLFDEKIKLKKIAISKNQGESDTVMLDGLDQTDATQNGLKTVKGSGIKTRQDVIFAIDEICKYFESYEPSSPVPFLLQRAKKLLSMNFMEILQDLTPESVSQAEKICGVTKSE